MRCSGWSSLAISACSGGLAALFLAAPASAHVIATPNYVASKGSESFLLATPNEREKPMTSFVVKVPKGLEIVHVHPASGWTESFTGSTATWTGGSLPPRKEVGFNLTLKATAQPGTLDLDAEQHYPDGGIVQWPVALTITPAAKSPSQNLALAGVVGLIGILVIAAIVMLARRRSPARPQEE